MPSSITHQLIAEETAKRLPRELKETVDRAPDEYYLGCQGPDMFFFYRIGSKKEYNLGKFLHRYRVFETFEHFLRAVQQDGTNARVPRFGSEERTQALSYILGYITHYAADSTFHPFVYHYLDVMKSEKFVHQQMENDWDVYFLRELRGRETENFAFAFSYEPLAAHKTVARLYNYLSKNLERDEVKRRKFENGLKNFCRYLKFFHGKCYRSQRGWARTEKLFHTKKYLSALYPRKDPEPSFLYGAHYKELTNGKGENADELFAAAVAEAVRLCGLFYEALEGKPLVRNDFGRGLLTGEVL